MVYQKKMYTPKNAAFSNTTAKQSVLEFKNCDLVLVWDLVLVICYLIRIYIHRRLI